MFRMRPKRPILRTQMRQQNPYDGLPGPYVAGNSGSVKSYEASSFYCNTFWEPAKRVYYAYSCDENNELRAAVHCGNVFDQYYYRLNRTCPTPPTTSGADASPGATHAPPDAKWYAATHKTTTPANAPKTSTGRFPWIRVTKWPLNGEQGQGVLYRRADGPGRLVTLWKWRNDTAATSQVLASLATVPGTVYPDRPDPVPPGPFYPSVPPGPVYPGYPVPPGPVYPSYP